MQLKLTVSKYNDVNKSGYKSPTLIIKCCHKMLTRNLILSLKKIKQYKQKNKYYSITSIAVLASPRLCEFRGDVGLIHPSVQNISRIPDI